MAVIDIKDLPISPSRDLKTVIGFDEQNELIKATYSNNDDFLVISPVELGINENNVFKSPYTIGEWKNILNSNKTIILRMPIQANSMDNIEDSEVNYCERYFIGSDIFTGVQIIFKWYTLYFLLNSDDNYIPNIRLYKTEPLRYDALITNLDERVTTLDENVTSLDNRVTTLENNGGDTSSIYLFKDENYTISPTNIVNTKIDLKAGKRVVLNNYFSNSETLFEVIGYDEYEKNDEWYTSISAIKGYYLYIWSTEFESAGNVIPKKINLENNGANI